MRDPETPGRGRVRALLSAALALAGLVAGGLALVQVAGEPARPEHALAQESPRYAVALSVSRDGIVVPATPTPSPTPEPHALPKAAADLRVWSDGDSVSYFMTTNLFRLLTARGAVPVRSADYKISSRLAGAGGRSAVLGVPFSDWFSYMPGEMSSYTPDVVVFMIGTNDAGYVNLDTYRGKVGAMMDLLEAPGRIVAWVGLPAFVREDLAANAPALNAIFAEEAASRPWVVFVDTSSIVPDAPDGVHFGPTRARLLAEAVIAALFPE
jgi:hypothetical protein